MFSLDVFHCAMTTKLPRFIAVTLTLTAIFWASMLVQQAAFLWRTSHMAVDPLIRSFASRYSITSTLEVFVFTAFAGSLSIAVYSFRSFTAACGLFILSGLAVWRYFFAGTSIFFHRPLGDGSWSGAFASYYHFHCAHLGVYLFQTTLLFALLILWLLSLPLLYGRSQNI